MMRGPSGKLIAYVFLILCIMPGLVLPGRIGAHDSGIPSGFVDIKKEIPDIVIDIRYATSNNFIGEPLLGYEKGCAWGVREMVNELKKVQAELRLRGYGLKVLDAYRPLSAEWHMIQWALSTNKRHLLGVYVPSAVKPLSRFGHTSGNMIDVTLVDSRGKELDMGSGFDEFSSRSHTVNTKGESLQNRLLLVRIMKKYGFMNYSKEWWHFSFKRAPHPALNVPIR